MKFLRALVSSLCPVGLLVLQLSCGGGDAAGPTGTPSQITASTSTTVVAPPGAAVLEVPAVLVRDASGAPLANVPVTFEVTGGGGSVTGGNATTNASGIATVGSWTIGSATVNTLTATTGTLAPVVFTGCATAAHTLDSPVDGELANTDCHLKDNTFTDFYTITIPTAGTYVFNQTSTTFDTYLTVYSEGGTIIGVNDDLALGVNDSRVKVIVPAGTYIVSANSFSANVLGTYSLASTASTTPVTNCEDVFVLPGITSAQSLEDSDCNTNSTTPSSGNFYDDYVIFLSGGQSITVAMSSTTGLDSYVELRPAGSGTVLASNDNIDATTKNARLTFTVPNSAQATGFYIITAASPIVGVIGDYTISIQ